MFKLASLNWSHGAKAKNSLKKFHVPVWCLGVLSPRVRKQIAQADMVSDVQQTQLVLKKLQLKRRLEKFSFQLGLAYVRKGRGHSAE